MNVYPVMAQNIFILKPSLSSSNKTEIKVKYILIEASFISVHRDIDRLFQPFSHLLKVLDRYIQHMNKQVPCYPKDKGGVNHMSV